MHPWVFFDEFHEVSMLVLLPIAIWGLWYISCGLFFVWLFDSGADPDDVLECSLLKYTDESEESSCI